VAVWPACTRRIASRVNARLVVERKAIVKLLTSATGQALGKMLEQERDAQKRAINAVRAIGNRKIDELCGEVCQLRAEIEELRALLCAENAKIVNISPASRRA